MPTFEYVAMTVKGERVAGELAGASEQSVLAELEGRSLTPVSLREQEEGTKQPRRVASTRQLATAYVQLADLLRAGVPLLRGLRLLGAQKSQPKLAKVFAEVADAVSGGSDLAEAMTQHPEAFPPIHIAMVRAGEKGGFLEQVLGRLGEFMTARAEMQSRVIGSLIYPCVLVGAFVVVVGFIFGLIIPQFRQIFDKLQLGLLTRSVLWLSDVAHAWGLWLLAGGVVLAVALWRLSKHPRARQALERVQLSTPVVGPLLKAMAVARFCRILGTMLANSIPMLTAMQIARDAAGIRPMEQAIDEATEAVRQGQPLAPPLASSGLMGDDVVEMIAVGESANNLDSVLLTVAHTLEGRVDRMLQAAVKLIEPLILVAMSVLIALVAMALILPLTKVSQMIGN